MQPALKEIKNELGHLDLAGLSAVCLRLARHKKENKELLHFLLFYADDPEGYATLVKESLKPEFTQLHKRDYFALKTLRKILRQLNKHARFTASKLVEADLLTWFCKNFLIYTNTSSTAKPLRTLFIRQLVKIAKLGGELEDDLAHDTAAALERIIQQAEITLKSFKRTDVRL